MEGKFELLKMRQFGDVINDSVGFVKRYIKPVGYAILVLVVPAYMLGSFLYASGITSAINPGHAANILNLKRVAISSVAGLLILMIGHVLLSAVFISAFVTIEKSETGDIDSQDVFSNLKENLSRLVRLYFLLFFIGGSAAGLVVLIAVALVSISAQGLMVLLMLVFVVVVIYLSISLAFVPIVYMREMCSFGEAVSRSFYLVKQNWWWTFLILFVAGLIGSIGGGILGIPYAVLTSMKTFTTIRSGHAGHYDMGLADRAALALNNFGGIITTTIVTIVTFIQYYSLVEKKDGVNLMQQIDSIGENEKPSY